MAAIPLLALDAVRSGYWRDAYDMLGLSTPPTVKELSLDRRLFDGWDEYDKHASEQARIAKWLWLIECEWRDHLEPPWEQVRCPHCARFRRRRAV